MHNFNLINVCGKRGLGDLVQGTSYILERLQQPTLLQYWLPSGFDYHNTINTIIYQYTPHAPVNVLGVVNEEWSSVGIKKAYKKFDKKEQNKTWYFINNLDTSSYIQFRDAWLGDKNGPIGLCLNNENNNPGYPYPSKWFDGKLNHTLLQLVDNSTYYFLGRPGTIQQNIDIMTRCRYVIGVDGAWAHVANAMRVPFIMVRNNLPKKIINNTHRNHPTLKVIETTEVFNYLI